MRERHISKSLSLLFKATIVLSISISAQAVVVPVAQDCSVIGQDYASQNLNGNTFNGGLFSGVDGLAGNDNPSRFYLKFNLPAYTPGTIVSSATLTGFYNADWSAADDRTHSLYLAANDSWTETSITWNTQPGPTGSALGVFNAAVSTPSNFLSWTITGAANGEYLGDGVLSVMFRADDESLVGSNNNWEYFASKEYDPTLAFRLTLEITQVPEPAAASMLVVGILAFFARLRLSARQRST